MGQSLWFQGIRHLSDQRVISKMPVRLTVDIMQLMSVVGPTGEGNSRRLASERDRCSVDLEYAQDTVRSIGVIVGEEPCCISPTILKPWRS
jgi:hypothetical protein